jgi:hypothetical protein
MSGSAIDDFPFGSRPLVCTLDRRGRCRIEVSARDPRAVELQTLTLLPPGTIHARLLDAATGPQRLDLEDGRTVLAVVGDVGRGIDATYAVRRLRRSTEIVTTSTLDEQRQTERLCRALANTASAPRARPRTPSDGDGGGREFGIERSTRPGAKRDESQLEA